MKPIPDKATKIYQEITTTPISYTINEPYELDLHSLPENAPPERDNPESTTQDSSDHG